MSLHTNEICIIQGNMTTMTGSLENTNCAYYPDYNVGCGVKDERDTSFGAGFNSGGGGVYAMQWTSESINIWVWPRLEVPTDVDNKVPDPGSWGLPSAQLGVGNCSVDQHFQSHKIIFDTTFCGEYAGATGVWGSGDANSCQASTNLTTCDNYVANHPEAFENAYWSINYVRVYQLVDPEGGVPSATYIASEQAPSTPTNAYTAPVATPNLDIDSLCPEYNFQIISDGKYEYEIACGYDPPGPDITGLPYDGFEVKSMADCIAGCTYLNENNGTNSCGAVAVNADVNNPFCYFKKYIDATPTARTGFNEIRLMYYGYPQITDNPDATADSTFTSTFVETIPTPQTYRPLTTTFKATTTSVANTSSSTMTTSDPGVATLPPALGNNITSSRTLPPDYSESVRSDYLSSTSTTSSVSSPGASVSTTSSASPSVVSTSTTFSATSSVSSTSTTSPPPSSITSTDPQVINNDFLIAFNVDSAARRLSKRAVRYLAFDDDQQSILVANEDEAARFYLDTDGSAKSGTQFVSVDTAVQPPRFTLQDNKPSDPVQIEIDEDGYVSVQGVEGFCLTPDNALAVVEDSEEQASQCVSVEPALVPALTTTSTTRSAAATSLSSTSIQDISTTTTTNAVSTADTGDSSDTNTASSAGSSLSSLSTTSGVSMVAPGSSFTSTSSIGQSPDTSTSQGGSSISTSSSISSTPTPSTTNDFVYAGCFGIPQDFGTLTGISLPLTDEAMDNNKCTAYCQGLNAYYAGTHETQCFCGTNTQLYGALLDYPEGACNTPCPGANRDICGGTVSFEAGGVPTTFAGANKHKRQADIILISLYNNTVLLPQPGESDVPTTGTMNPATVTDTITTRPSSASPYFPPDQVSYNVTGTNTATVISTTYVDVCDVCPGGLTTKATTITVPHCGCTASYDAHLQSTVPVASPSVPMVTTVKNCGCGHGGAQSSITVTVPCTSSIEELAAMVTQQAVPGAGAMGSVSAAAPAPAVSSGAVSPAASAAVPDNAAAAPAAANTLPAVVGTVAPPMGEAETLGPVPAAGNVARPANVNAAVGAAPGPMTTPLAAAAASIAVGASPAPASPPAIAENSGLMNPHASIVGTGSGAAIPLNANGTVSNATLPQAVQPNGSGIFSPPDSFVQSFSSSASRLVGLSRVAGESGRILAVLVGGVMAGVAGAL